MRAGFYWRRRARRAERLLAEQQVRAAQWREAGEQALKDRESAFFARGLARDRELALRNVLANQPYLERKIERMQKLIDDMLPMVVDAASQDARDKQTLLRCHRTHCNRWCRDEEDDW